MHSSIKCAQYAFQDSNNVIVVLPGQVAILHRVIENMVPREHHVLDACKEQVDNGTLLQMIKNGALATNLVKPAAWESACHAATRVSGSLVDSRSLDSSVSRQTSYLQANNVQRDSFIQQYHSQYSCRPHRTSFGGV